MTRLRAAIAANVVLAILAFFLIATDWREGDASARHGNFKIVGPAKLSTLSLPPAVYRRQVLTATYAAAPPVRVRPVQRAKPPIAGRDLMTGKPLSLAQFRDKAVFVSVWATWNVGSLAQASTIGRFARSHAREVAFLGVDSEDSQPDARAFARRWDMDFPSIHDPIGIIAAAWSPVPTTLVFDRKHVLVEKIEGSASLAQLNTALQRVTG